MSLGNPSCEQRRNALTVLKKRKSIVVQLYEEAIDCAISSNNV